jgi:hypothetical protein
VIATLYSESDTLSSGSLVTVLPMGETGEPRTTTISARLGREDPGTCPISIVRSRPLWSYRLARPDHREKSVRVGLAVVNLKSAVRRVGTRLAADLDGDGVSELVTRCADSDGLQLLVRAERGNLMLWAARCQAFSHAHEPTCTDEDEDLH